MQTTQVSNAANLLTTPSNANKQSGAQSTESFGKVLSREVSERNHAQETGRRADAPAASRPASRTTSKSAEAAPSEEGKAADNAATESDTTGATMLSAEMLALVANLAALNSGPTHATEASQLPEESSIDPTALSIIALPAEAKSDIASIDVSADANPGANSGLAGLLGGQDGAARQMNSAEIDLNGRDVPPLQAGTDSTVQGEELITQANTGPASDFASAVSEAVSGAGNSMPSVQQTGMQAVQQQSANTAERLTPRVGTPAWDQALGQKVVWMVAGEHQSASLTLNPPDLGPLQVVLNVNNSQANATFIAAQPEVRQALEAALPKLRDMLNEAGIQLGQASVNSGTPGQQGGFDQQGSRSARGLHTAGDADSGATVTTQTANVRAAPARQGLVDTFV